MGRTTVPDLCYKMPQVHTTFAMPIHTISLHALVVTIKYTLSHYMPSL